MFECHRSFCEIFSKVAAAAAVLYANSGSGATYLGSDKRQRRCFFCQIATFQGSGATFQVAGAQLCLFVVLTNAL